MGFSATGPGRNEDSPRQLELYRAELGDAEAKGIVHVTNWHETYAHLLSSELLAKVTPERRVDMWRPILGQPGENKQYVAEDNPRTQAFYRRNRFELDGARKVEERRGELLPGVGMVR